MHIYFQPFISFDKTSGGIFHLLLGSILTTFYAKPLQEQIPKAQKIHSSCQFLAFLGSALVKDLSKMLLKLTPDAYFFQNYDWNASLTG